MIDFALFQKEDQSGLKHIDPKTKEVKYNPKYSELFAPQVCMQSGCTQAAIT